MDALSIVSEQKMVTCRYLTVDGKRYSPSSVIEVLEELEGCDGLFISLTISNDKLAAMLVTQGAAVPTIRGSYRAGDNRQALLDKVYALYYSETDGE